MLAPVGIIQPRFTWYLRSPRSKGDFVYLTEMLARSEGAKLYPVA